MLVQKHRRSGAKTNPRCSRTGADATMGQPVARKKKGRRSSGATFRSRPAMPCVSARLPLAAQPVLFVGLLDKHRRQLSSTGATHPNPFHMVRKLHHDLSSLEAKANPELHLIVDLAKSI